MPRLDQRVLDERRAGFVGIGNAEIGLRDELDAGAGEHLADLGELARVAAGRDDEASRSVGQRLALFRAELGDAFGCEREQRVELLATERVAFGGALQLDEAAAVVHDDVHVGVAAESSA